MWDFVNKGVSNTSTSTKRREDATSRGGDNLDDLLSGLDDVVSTRPRASNKGRKDRRSYETPAKRRRHDVGSARRRRERTPERHERETEDEPIDFNQAFDDGDDDKGYDAPEVDFGGDDNGDVFMEEAEPAKEEKAEEESKDEEEKLAEAVQTASRTRKLGRLAAAAKAKEKKEAAEKQAKLLEEQRAKELASMPPKEKTVKFVEDVKLDSSSTSFRPDSIAAAASSDVITGNNDLEAIVQKEANVEMTEADDNSEATGPRRYLDVFWLDASERNGVVYLYGKVKAPNAGNETFQSCCVTIPNNFRNLFVLPRVQSDSEDGERHSITDVYGEMESVLRPSCIPRVQGASWSAKPVKRSYAFEDPTIPRGQCEYLKVIYDAKYPVPEREVCMKGGQTFEKILGASAPTLENFLVKRRLMGPGWLRIYDPQAVKGNVSWCKWECTVEGPKSIKRLDLVTEGGEKVTVPPPPPVSTVSIKFKTVVNPYTQKLEIVCVSAICHSRVLLDSASDESTKHMTQLTLVRPLAGPESNGTMPQFPRDMEKEMKRMPGLSKSPNERALLSRFFAQIGNWDPDILVSHNGWGHDIDVLLSRCVELKVNMWSKIGRRVQLKLPPASQFGNGKDWAIASALDGRILCDTFVSAKELLRETSYSLTNLTSTQLKETRDEIEQVDIPLWCRNGQHFVDLANHTLKDAQLVQKLMFKLQILPLTKQLTNIAGNLWARTMKGNRAERNEYLLLHEFHQLKYLVPEKRTAKQRKEDLGDDDDTGNGKAKYSGGLVLDPKKGLYDSFILLLDFNSLYPSLIQEYNLCFTTMEWAKSTSSADAGENEQQGDQLPPLPDDTLERGVLPRVIKTLVERRRNVKKMIKSEKNPDKLEEVSKCFVSSFLIQVYFDS
jgi:DNA polymerase Pol2